jgi:hypothetical protein
MNWHEVTLRRLLPAGVFSGFACLALFAAQQEAAPVAPVVRVLIAPGGEVSAAEPASVVTRIHISSVQVPLEEMVALADEIVIGNVRSQRYVPGPGGLPCTEATIDVYEALKGSPEAAVTIQFVGGRIGNRAAIAMDAPTFKDGDVVLLFLEQVEPGAPRALLGLKQGTYRVRTDGPIPTVDGKFADGEVLASFESRLAELIQTSGVGR